jgi:hypothetical protein
MEEKKNIKEEKGVDKDGKVDTKKNEKKDKTMELVLII